MPVHLETLESRRLLAAQPALAITARIPVASETDPVGTGMGQFLVRLSAPAGANVSIGYYLRSTSTARPGTDFLPLAGSVTIRRGAAYNYIRVIPVEDSTAESSETVELVLRPVAGYTITRNKAIVTIHDNDSAVYVSPTGNDGNPGTKSAPFKTLRKARDFVRTINRNMAGDITVILRGGDYPLSSPIGFDQRDSGTNGHRIMWRAYADESAIVTAGVRLTNWTAESDGTFFAATGGAEFLQLYVDGRRAVRARIPESGEYNVMSWNTTDRTIAIAESDAAILRSLSPQQLEQVRITILGKGVNQATLRIASISGNVVTPRESERSLIFTQSYPPKEDRPYFLEGARAFVSAPGEFHLDLPAQRVYYRPRNGEDPAAGSVVTVPRAQELVRIEGTIDDPIANIEFYGLTFQETNWLRPAQQGFIGDQASFRYVGALPEDEITSYPSEPIPAAVHVAHARDLRFEHNTFRNTGASAVNFWIDVDECDFVGNLIENTAASGITIDLNLQGNPADARNISVGNTITNNAITGIGLDYYQSAGIVTTYAASTVIEHNEISNTSYSGISVGWGWADVPNAAQNNSIRFNRIHDVLQTMADGAAIYTLSRQPGTVIAENYIHDIVRRSWHGSFPLAGIFLDEGSNLIAIRDNVGVNVQDTMLFQNATGGGNFFTNNDGFSAAVIANAGIEPAYRRT